MKKTFSIILLVSISLHTIGSYLIYKRNLGLIKKEMKASISSLSFIPEELSHILVPDIGNETLTDEVEWVEEDEIYYHGEMYDVIGSTDDGRFKDYTCIADSDETLLVEAFANEMERKGASPLSGKRLGLVKFAFSNFVVTEPISIAPTFIQETFLSPYIKKIHLDMTAPNIPSPPPWLS